MVIFLNGSVNAGKSTVAELLKKKIPNTAVIEIDKLRHFIDWISLDEAIPVNLANTADLIKNFAKAGINSIVPYPLSQNNYDFLTEKLKNLNEKIYFFTLSPTLEIALSDRGERKLDEQERERIKYHYGIKIHQPSFGRIIDNTNQTPDQTVQEVLDYIKQESK